MSFLSESVAFPGVATIALESKITLVCAIGPWNQTFVSNSNVHSTVLLVVMKTPDSDAIFDSDSRVSPRITNLSDSDGNVIKIVRDFNL
jgi:hypothetical protein